MLIAQTAGYEELPWGSSVKEIRVKYPNIVRTNYSNSDFKDAIKYIVKYSSCIVIQREFTVWKNKLVKVLVMYNPDEIYHVTLGENFLDKFGKPIDDLDEEVEVNNRLIKKTDFYWNSNGTHIVLRVLSKSFVEDICAIYVSLSYVDDYFEAEKSKKIEF